MQPSRLTCLVLATALCCAGVASAQHQECLRVADMGALLPGATEVVSWDGGFPPAPPLGRELAQMPGFPKTVPISSYFAPNRGLLFADLDADGDQEIICGSTDKQLHAWDYEGNYMPGFPVTLNNMCQFAAAIGDLDGNGYPEIVQFTRGPTSGGRIYILDHLGQTLPGFPLNVNNKNIEMSPVLYDLDQDGVLEIIACERAYPLGNVHIFEMDGTEWGGNWPFAMQHVPAATPAVGDLDGDGDVEIVCIAYNAMYVLNVDGTVMPGWPRLTVDQNFSYQSPALADIDGDGDLEIVIGAHGNLPQTHVWHHDGTDATGWPINMEYWTYCPPTVTDLEGDGQLDIINGQAGDNYLPSNCFFAWTATGELKPNFPYMMPLGGSEGAIVTADINGDGQMEIFTDYRAAVDNYGYVFGTDALGNDLPGFPLRPLGLTYMNGPTIGDIDNDGHYELAVTSRHETFIDINLYKLPDTYKLTNRDWLTYHGNNARTGLYPVVRLRPGDLNCDGRVNFRDINGFVLALTDPPAYEAMYANCDMYVTGDLNGDGAVNEPDVNRFVSLLTGR